MWSRFSFLRSNADRFSSILSKRHSSATTSPSATSSSSMVATSPMQASQSFAIYAAFGLTVFSLSTLYAFQRSHQAKVCAAAPDRGSEAGSAKEWDFNWDDRSFSPSNTIRSFTLIRHGQYEHEPNPLDKILTKLGREQAKCAGQRLKSMDIEYDEIICSTMVRAKQTADIIVNEVYGTNEVGERTTISGKKKKLPRPSIQYDGNLNEGAPSYVIPERNDLRKSGFFKNVGEDSERISDAFKTYIHRNDTDEDTNVLFIGHGNVFRYFMCRVLQFPAEAWLRFSLCNCGITRFKVYGDGRVSVQCIGCDGHLEKAHVTYN